MVPAKPLPLETPVTSTVLAGLEQAHVERLADLVVGDVVDPELAHVADARQVLELARAGAW